jgi:hypothetical protein
VNSGRGRTGAEAPEHCSQMFTRSQALRSTQLPEAVTTQLPFPHLATCGPFELGSTRTYATFTVPPSCAHAHKLHTHTESKQSRPRPCGLRTHTHRLHTHAESKQSRRRETRKLNGECRQQRRRSGVGRRQPTGEERVCCSRAKAAASTPPATRGRHRTRETKRDEETERGQSYRYVQAIVCHS